MAMYHPDSNMLLEYAAGTLDWALSVSVSAHTHMCNQCRQQALHLSHIGGALIETAPTIRPSRDTFRRLMNRIEQAQASDSIIFTDIPEQRTDAAANLKVHNITNVAVSDLPQVVRKLIPEAKPLQWKRISPSLRKACLSTGQDHYEVSLHQITRGGSVPPYTHRGMEITLVLAGSFSDVDGVYSIGDFLTSEVGERHNPTATQNQDCLCLSVAQAPLAFSGIRGWMVNPFLSFQPR